MMKNFLKKIFLFIIPGFFLTGCAFDTYDDGVYATAEPDVNVIITYGTPYWYSGSLYWLYNGIYYYPYYYNNYRYMRPIGPRFRPNPPRPPRRPGNFNRPPQGQPQPGHSFDNGPRKPNFQGRPNINNRSFGGRISGGSQHPSGGVSRPAPSVNRSTVQGSHR